MIDFTVNPCENLPAVIIMTFSLETKFLPECTLKNKSSTDLILVPPSCDSNHFIEFITVISIVENPKSGEYEKIKIQFNGQLFLYSIQQQSGWHIYAKYPDHIAKKFSVISLENGLTSEILYLLKLPDFMESEVFNLGGKITVLLIGESSMFEELSLYSQSGKSLVKFGHGFGIFLGGLYGEYKKLYDSICSNN